MRANLDYWAWRAGLEPIPRLLYVHGWSAHDVLTRIGTAYHVSASEATQEAIQSAKIQRNLEKARPRKR